jgi:hypothetical protein
MDLYALFATWNYPNFDLVGAKSVGFLIVFTLLAALSFPWVPIRDIWRQRIILLRPALTPLGFLVIGYLREYKHYDAQLDCSRIICLAFGMAFCLAAMRCYGIWPKIWAASALVLHLQALAVFILRFIY